MFWQNWQSYIKDDTPLSKIAIPGAHNAGSYDMNFLACCQDGTLYEQFLYGVRYFNIRLHTNKDGTIVLAHGPLKGHTFVSCLIDLQNIITSFPNEFIILDIREYYPQKLGIINITHNINTDKMNELLEKYIIPSKYALTNFDDISKVTLGEIRKQNKRYLLVNYQKAYNYSVDNPIVLPWHSKTFYTTAKKFVNTIPKYLSDSFENSLVCFQIQRTFNTGFETGFTSPRKLEKHLFEYFPELFENISINPKYVKNVNIVAGDFMTKSYQKARHILMLNLLKGIVIEDKITIYFKNLWSIQK
ncbi:MAG: hypothetical protein WCR54_03115 [Clostridia bacterium]